MTKMDIALKKCMTPEFRVSFPAVFKPKAFKDQEAKYSLVMLFDKKTDLKELKRAATNAMLEKWPEAKDPERRKKLKLKMPFRDGDEKEDTQGYKGTIFVSASSKTKPGLVNQRREAIITEEVGVDGFYAGCFARSTLIAFAYDQMGNKGVSFSLQNVQKLRDGDSLSGRKKAEDEFDEVQDSSNDPASYAGDDLGDMIN